MFSFLWFSHFGLLPFLSCLLGIRLEIHFWFGFTVFRPYTGPRIVLHTLFRIWLPPFLLARSALLWRLLRIWLEIRTALNWFNLSWGKDAAANFACYNAASGWSFMNPFSWRKATCVFNQSVDTGSQHIATKSNRGGFVADFNCYLMFKLCEMKLRRKVRHFIVKKFSSSLLTESITIVLSS